MTEATENVNAERPAVSWTDWLAAVRCKLGLHDKGWWRDDFYSTFNGKPFGSPAQTFFWWWECRRCGKRKGVKAIGG